MKEDGAACFEEFYSRRLGARWPALRAALLAPVRHRELRMGPGEPYFLDEASVAAAEALPVSYGGVCLDLCAAPGGKTLVLAGRLGAEGRLVANELSGPRRARLRNVLQQHLLGEVCGRVRVTGHDALRWPPSDRDCYDAILLDAPCSSERHVLLSPPDLAQWSPARVKSLARRQKDMLFTAFRLCRPGGEILYCTCSLAAEENEENVERFVRKKGGAAEVLPSTAPWGEACGPGWIILPDACGGRGPIFFARLRRLV